MSDPDLRLARKACRGDRRALGRLYERHKSRLLGYLVRMLGRRQLAEDVFQEVWVKVLQNIDRYSPESGASFRSWLFRVAANAAVDRIRYESRREGARRTSPDEGHDPDDVELLVSTAPGPEREAGGRHAAEVLAAMLRRLPDRQRAAVLLRHQQGMSYPEIAAVLAVPQGTAKTLVHRGVLALRDALSRSLGNASPETGPEKDTHGEMP